MNARIVAVCSLEGGVGKTTLAVNLAWAAAALSSRRTLLWDLDGQTGATGARDPRWRVLPMASACEDMTERRAPLGAYAPRASPAVKAVATVWRRVESALVAAA